jgi:hypothetical protein
MYVEVAILTLGRNVPLSLVFLFTHLFGPWEFVCLSMK